MDKKIVPYYKSIVLSQEKTTKVGYWWFAWLNQWKWCAHKNGNVYYAEKVLQSKGKTICVMRLHRVVIKSKKGTMVDHIDGDGLNNTESNLRLCNNAQNSTNRRSASASGFLGVFKQHIKRGSKTYKYWVSYIQFNKSTIYIGTFDFTEEGKIEAAKAYDKMALELFGEFANPNFK